MKRPQNVKRPWKIEYKNGDGRKVTFPSSYCTALAAVQAAASNWLRHYAEPDSYCEPLKSGSITEAQDNNSFVEMTDGFHTYTIFHRDSVVYK